MYGSSAVEKIMKKACLAALLLFVISAAPSICQSQKKAAASGSGKVGDSFAKSAILAVRAIQDQHSKDASKSELDKLDAADAEAVKESEQAVVSKLRFFVIVRSIHYLKLEAAATMAEATKKPAPADDRELSDACLNGLVENLRLRSAAIPASCPKETSKGAN
jgi:hypothetical protein